MDNKYIAKTSRIIDSPVPKVWKALTDPAQIKQYLFGTEATTDWKKGSDITYKGKWKGRDYTDKGKIIEIEPGKLLHTTYLSGMSGKEDKPENYVNVRYELEPEGPKTLITIAQDGINSEDELQHMKENWGMVLDGMKKMLEGSR